MLSANILPGAWNPPRLAACSLHWGGPRTRRVRKVLADVGWHQGSGCEALRRSGHLLGMGDQSFQWGPGAAVRRGRMALGGGCGMATVGCAVGKEVRTGGRQTPDRAQGGKEEGSLPPRLTGGCSLLPAPAVPRILLVLLSVCPTKIKYNR